MKFNEQIPSRVQAGRQGRVAAIRPVDERQDGPGRRRGRTQVLLHGHAMVIVKRGVSTLLAFLIPLAAFAPLSGSAGPLLGSAQRAAVPGSSTVTGAGRTTTKRASGLALGTSITGLDSVALMGPAHRTDTLEGLGQTDETTAYDAQKLLAFTDALNGQDFAAKTLNPDVNRFASPALFSGTLAIDLQSRRNAQVVIPIGGKLTTATGPKVAGKNRGPADAVSFEVGSSTTPGSDTASERNTLAHEGIALAAPAQILCGQALSRAAAVTSITNTIPGNCASGGDLDSRHSGFTGLAFGAGAAAGGPNHDVPEPSTGLLLLAVGLIGVGSRTKKALRV